MVFRKIQSLGYRMLTPKWAHQPYSGNGAALCGGRFNRKGNPALYLSLEPETAVAEFAQSSPIFGPGTLACYRLVLTHVVDFSGGYAPHWDSLWQSWDCEWKRLAYMEGIEPPSWVIADLAQSQNASGILFPSTKRVGGTNLVIYPESVLVGQDEIMVHDPDGHLPKHSGSWDE